jgi:hypothetical protein
MTFVPDTAAALEAAQLASYANRFPGKDVSTESFLGKLSRAEAQGLWTYEQRLLRISLDSVPNSQSTYARLSDWAAAIGLSDGAGGFGPLKATTATGLTGQANGTNGATIHTTDILTAPDGVTQFAPTANVTLGFFGATLTVNAITAGTAGNLGAGSVLTFVSPPLGVAATVTVTQGATNGTDQESAQALLARIDARLQNPPKGGAQSDWNGWPQAAVTSALRTYGYAKRNGTGTVDEVMTYAGASGSARLVSAGDLAKIATYVDSVRPVTVAGRRLLAPTTPHSLTLHTRIIATAAGAFDWSSAGLTLTVSAFSPGTGFGGSDQLTLNTDAPTSLQIAIAAYVAGTGPAPRIQIVATGGSVIPVQVQAIRYAQVAGPAAKLDLVTTGVAGWIAPTIGNGVFSGGPAVNAIASAQLAYVDGLGPSRVSGYADPNDAWQDTVEIAQLMGIATSTVDASGNKLAKNIVFSGTTPQVTIAIDAGAAATSDYATSDTISSAPEIAVCAHVVVTD